MIGFAVRNFLVVTDIIFAFSDLLIKGSSSFKILQYDEKFISACCPFLSEKDESMVLVEN